MAAPIRVPPKLHRGRQSGSGKCQITCQSTRTHNSRRRHRRLCWWSGHFYVMWHWLLMFSVATALRTRGAAVRVHCARSLVTLLGVSSRHSGESHACLAGRGHGRRHVYGAARRRALPFGAGASPSAGLVGARVAGAPPVLAASEAMPPFTCQHLRCSATASHNKSANTDRVTAGCACLRASGCLQRYVAMAEPESVRGVQ